MKNTIFTGLATALVTAMTADGIDYEALGRVLEFQIENGINALVVMGTTGENATIEYEDQKEIIRFTVEKVAKRVPVIAGTKKLQVKAPQSTFVVPLCFAFSSYLFCYFSASAK